jgi:hypothetical protein
MRALAAIGIALMGAACGGPGRGGDAAAPDAVALDAGVDATEHDWPNAESSASSDPWLAEHHDRIRTLRPRVLALNFVNAKTNAQMIADVEKIMAALAEGSRWHGWDDASAPAMLQPELVAAIDLRDDPVPAGWPWNNSTLYPREDPPAGTWGFDYAALFGDAFAARYGFGMDLCAMVDAGLVHEVWVYVDGDVPGEAGMAELLEMKPYYDDARRRLDELGLDFCAGNGCFDADDLPLIPPHCTRTVRIASINHARGTGCFLENVTHGFESTASTGVIPYLRPWFLHFADMDLDARYGTPFASWYACPYDRPDCITYTGPTSLDYDVGFAQGSIDDYRPVCGQGHIPPNGRGQYDYWGESPIVTISSCDHFRLLDGPGGADATEPFESVAFNGYNELAPDCGGGWHVYWFQSFPGYRNRAIADEGEPMLPWWPFLYY